VPVATPARCTSPLTPAVTVVEMEAARRRPVGQEPPQPSRYVWQFPQKYDS
jgi:hypothetical protein